MSGDRWDRVESIYHAALDREPADRLRFLEQACGSDCALRCEVEAVLKSHESAPGFLQTPVLSAPNDDFEPLSLELTGRRIGRYLIERVIASGGMGVVYLAQQEEPRRPVALKVMRGGIKSRSALRRFQDESQILARLRHPNIAQVHEAGTHTADSVDVPYFAMEYIPDARTIIEFAREKQLSIRDRVLLLVKVCDALHHGHQRGIIHRDIKPGNILVDQAGVPRIIDFGVARVTSPDVSTINTKTDVGMLIGTLQYMSPEQCDGDPADIDTRSDIYALGVVLYELLCGELPYAVSGASIASAARIIREESPTRPSALTPSLKGDLETITLKALQKDPAARYQSADELARDLRAFLDCRPIEARPPSLAYHARKMAARHKPATALATLVLLLLVAFGVTTTIQAQRILAERDRASREAIKANRASAFLQSLLSYANPKNVGHDITMREVVDRAVEDIPDALGDDPEVEADVREAIGGSAYWASGRLADAKKQLAIALEIRQALFGDASDEVVPRVVNYCDLLRFKGDWDEAEALLSNTLKLIDDDSPFRPDLLEGLGKVYTARCAYATAEPYLLEALAIRRDRYGEVHADTAKSLDSLAELAQVRGDIPTRVELLEQVLAIRLELHGRQHLDVTETMGYLALAMTRRAGSGDLAESERLLREALVILPGLVGDEHLDVAWITRRLAATLAARGEDDEAYRLFHEALDMIRRTLGDNHHEVANTIDAMSSFLITRGHMDEAERLLREGIAIRSAIFGEDYAQTRYLAGVLADVLDPEGHLP